MAGRQSYDYKGYDSQYSCDNSKDDESESSGDKS